MTDQEFPDKRQKLARSGSREANGKVAGSAPALTLDSTAKKVFAGLFALIGAAAGISVFTGPFTHTASGLILVTLGALGATLLIGVGVAALYTYLRNGTPARAVAIAAVFGLAAGSAIGYLAWHSRQSPTTRASGARQSSARSHVAPGPATAFPAQVAWTNDSGGGGSLSTNLYSFTTPNSHVHVDVYQLGEHLTVFCETAHGRAVQVGLAYEGPHPHSTIWYRLDNGSWVPAVYIRVNGAATVPTCS